MIAGRSSGYTKNHAEIQSIQELQDWHFHQDMAALTKEMKHHKKTTLLQQT